MQEQYRDAPSKDGYRDEYRSYELMVRRDLAPWLANLRPEQQEPWVTFKVEALTEGDEELGLYCDLWLQSSTALHGKHADRLQDVLKGIREHARSPEALLIPGYGKEGDDGRHGAFTD